MKDCWRLSEEKLTKHLRMALYEDLFKTSRVQIPAIICNGLLIIHLPEFEFGLEIDVKYEKIGVMMPKE